jgi:hypothetical protein
MAFPRDLFACIWFCGLALCLPRLSPAASPQADVDQGHIWLLRARKALAGHKTISAVIHQRIHLYEQELVGSGEYMQGPPEKNLLHFDLRLKVGQQDSYFQERCDGRFYWLQKFEDGLPKLTRIDVKRVLAARAAAGRAGPAEASMAGMLGLGGVASLVDQLTEWCVFPRVAQGKLPTKAALPVIVLEGGWRTERLLHWLPGEADAVSQGKPIDLGKLPPMLPDRIVVFLGRDDLFPRRIEYSVSDSRAIARGETEPLVQLHFEDVHFDEPLDPRYFTFSGGVVPPVDDTDGYLLRNGLLPATTALPAGR